MAVDRNLRPVALRRQHLHRRAVLHLRHDGRARARLRPHVQVGRCARQLHRRAHALRCGRRGLRGLRRRCLHGQICAAHVAHIAVCVLHLRPVALPCHHLDRHALGDLLLLGVGGRLRIHPCRSAGRRHHRHARLVGRRGRRLRLYTGLFHIAELDIARLSRVCHLSPAAIRSQQLQPGAVGNRRQHAGIGIRLRAQIQRRARAGQAHLHLIARRELRRLGRHLRTDRRGADGIRQGHLLERRARIIEAQDVLEALAIVQRHDARAVLAQADAVAEAPERNRIIVATPGHKNRLIAARIDGQVEQRLQLGIRGDVAGRREADLRAVGLLSGALHGELQLPVEDGRRGMLRRMGRDVRDLVDGHRALRQPRLGDIRGDAVDQPLAQRGVQRVGRRGIARNLRVALLGSGRLQVIGIILDHAVGQRSAPNVLRAVHLPAVAGAVIAFSQAAVRIQHVARRLVHGLNHPRVAGVVSLEYLGIGVVRHIIYGILARRRHHHGVVARGHGLRFQRLQRIAVGHLVGHHAVQIILDVDVQHGHDGGAAGIQHQVSTEHIADRRRRKADAAGAAALSGQRHAVAHAVARAVYVHVQPVCIGRYRHIRSRRNRHAARAICAVSRECQRRTAAQTRQLDAHCAALCRQRTGDRPRKTAAEQQQHQQQRRHAPEPCLAVVLRYHPLYLRNEPL